MKDIKALVERLRNGQVFYLIERTEASAFWTGAGWSPTALEAARYHSRAIANEALRVLFNYGEAGGVSPPDIFVTEHLWSDPVAADALASTIELRAELARIIALHKGLMAEANKRLDEATARAEASERDAKRYRWLRTNGRYRASWWQRFSTPEELDAALDAAERRAK